MSKSRSSYSDSRQAMAPSATREGFVRSWVCFWFTPADPIGLHCVRVLAGLLFLAWLLPFANQLDALFGLEGWFDRRAFSEAARLPGWQTEPLSWSLVYLCGSNSSLLAALYWTSVGTLVLFTLGILSRITAVLTWVIVVSFTANPVIAYDADALLVIVAFYLMIGYVLLGQRARYPSYFSRIVGGRDAWLFGRPEGISFGSGRPSLGANLAIRLLQVHMAIVICVSGVHKLQFADWWSGAAFWYPLHPPFATTIEDVRAQAPNAPSYFLVLSLGAYATLTWQIGFPMFAWSRWARPILLAGGAIAWLGCAFLYRLPLFGPVIFLACLSFLTPLGWRRVLSFLSMVPGLGRLGQGQLSYTRSVDEHALRAEAAHQL